MLKLKNSDPDTWQFFKDENFCVNKNAAPFYAIGVDHAMEQENKLMKVTGGIKGLTQNQAALDRFMLTSPTLSHLSIEFRVSAGIEKKVVAKHYQLTGSSKVRISKNVDKLVKKMEEFDVSFRQNRLRLQRRHQSGIKFGNNQGYDRALQ